MLVANEAQDIDPAGVGHRLYANGRLHQCHHPLLGTAWRRRTCAARQIAHLSQQQREDERTRVWKVGWEEIAETLPAYGTHVRQQIEQFGRDHPSIRTEYFLEELDDAGSLFPAQRLAHLRGDHPRRHIAEPGKRYALLIDVAGEDETPNRPGRLRSSRAAR